MDEKICVIGIYFGTLPDWFSLWLRSAALNPSIDFMLFLDHKIDELPQNVKVIDFSLARIKELAEKKLKMKVSLEKPYKLCDFKPVWGIILQDYIVGYHYWGHCDFDLLFGDIRGFTNRLNLSHYDKFLSLGHFALYRNDPRCYEYYRLSGSDISYELAFTREESCYFDEFNNINGIYLKNELPFYHDDSVFINVNPWTDRIQRFDFPNYKQQVFYWQDGKVFRYYIDENGEDKFDEYLYIHICKRKMNNFIRVPDKVNGIWVSKNSFIEKSEYKMPNKDDIEQYNGFVFKKEFVESIRFYIKDRIHDINHNIRVVLKKNRIVYWVYQMIREKR